MVGIDIGAAQHVAAVCQECKGEAERSALRISPRRAGFAELDGWMARPTRVRVPLHTRPQAARRRRRRSRAACRLRRLLAPAPARWAVRCSPQGPPARSCHHRRAAHRVVQIAARHRRRRGPRGRRMRAALVHPRPFSAGARRGRRALLRGALRRRLSGRDHSSPHAHPGQRRSLCGEVPRAMMGRSEGEVVVEAHLRRGRGG